MKTLAFLFTGAAALALGACADSGDDAPTDGETDVTVIEEDAPAPTVTETTVVEDGDDGSSLTVDGDDVDVRVDEDGAEVDAEVDTNN